MQYSILVSLVVSVVLLASGSNAVTVGDNPSDACIGLTAGDACAYRVCPTATFIGGPGPVCIVENGTCVRINDADVDYICIAEDSD